MTILMRLFMNREPAKVSLITPEFLEILESARKACCGSDMFLTYMRTQVIKNSTDITGTLLNKKTEKFYEVWDELFPPEASYIDGYGWHYSDYALSHYIKDHVKNHAHKMSLLINTLIN